MSAREAQLEAEVAQLREMIAELRDLVATLRSQIEQKDRHIERLVKMTFGRSTERHVGPSLFDEIEPPPSDTPMSPPIPPEIPAPPAKRRGHGRRPLPDNLPVVRTELDLTDAEKPCPCCGQLRVRIGVSEPSRRTDYRPASLFVQETVRVTYACHDCERAGHDPQFVKPPLPPEPIPRSSAAPGLLAHIIVSKFADHLPLYRQETILERGGFVIPRSTLCDWRIECASVLDPLYRAMTARVKASHAIHADETPVVLLRPRRSAFARVYLGDAANPFTVFDFTVGREDKYPANFLREFVGFMHCDGYAGYNRVHHHVRHVGCWMHVRRDFFDARTRDVRAVEALAFIRRLYAIEREAKDRSLSDTALSQYRREHAKPVLDAFATWRAEHHRTSLPSSGFGEAVRYAVNQWPSLIRFVEDGKLSIDNGPAERAIRPLAIGRRNWLFIGGDGGLSTAAVLLSVVASAKQHGLNPWLYLRDVLTRLPARPPNSDVTDLLPDRWPRLGAEGR